MFWPYCPIGRSVLEALQIPLNGIVILVTYLYPVYLKVGRSTGLIIIVNLLCGLSILWEVCEFVPMADGSTV
jgi:hypothetical protein